MSDTSRHMRAYILLLIAFTLSGGAGLMLQILWTQTASVFFGVSAHAIATTLAAFMGGLALGAWLGGRILTTSSWSPLRLYAVSEVVVAVSALGLQALFVFSTDAAAWFATVLPGQDTLGLGLRFLFLGALLLLPTSAMGASFPFFLRALMGRGKDALGPVSTAYGVNVLGAAAGCILTASVLLSAIGVTASVVLAAALNLTAAGLAWWVDRSRSMSTIPVETDAVNDKSTSTIFSAGALEALVAVSGFSAMAFEVIWSRMYRQALWLVNPFQAFAQILTLILVGMSLGALVLGFRSLDRGGALRWFSRVQVFLALSCILGITQIRWAVGDWLPMESTYAYRWVSMVALVLGALALGMGFPLLSAAHAGVREKMGRIYAYSALGGLLGTLAGGFVLVPWLGVRGGLLCLMGLFLVSGGLAILLRRGTAERLLNARGVAMICIGVLTPFGVGALTQDVLDFECKDCQTLWLKDGLEATTAVVQTPEGGNLLYTDGRAIMPGALPRRTLTPFLLAPVTDRVLSVGFGSGQLAMMMAENFPESQINSVELDGGMAATTGFFGTEGLFDRSNFTLHVDDGRQLLLRSPKGFDVIMADTFTHSINTQIYGSGFFTAAREALTDDGSFFITVPLQDLPSATEAEIILRTAAVSFPYVYVIAPKGMAAILGRTRPLLEPYTIQPLPKALRRQLKFKLTPNDIYPLTEDILQNFQSERINSDDRPYFFPLMQRSEPGSGERMRRLIRQLGGLDRQWDQPKQR